MVASFRVGDGDPLKPPPEGKCPIDDLPNELLSYVFQHRVDIKQGTSDDWDDVLEVSMKEVDEDGTSVNSDSMSIEVGSDLKNGEVQHDKETLPPQVLVSHVCRRWRSVALNTHGFWTTLAFRKRPRLAQMKEYISRSNGLPLTIDIDFYTEDAQLEYIRRHNFDSGTEDEVEVPSLEQLDQILCLLEPAISQWQSFLFYSRWYIYIPFLMSRLDKLPTAPFLECFEIHNILDGSEREPPDHTTRYLPFNGQAPSLKEVAFWEIHIDWERALPNFLRGLRTLDLSRLRRPIRPTYNAFAEIVKNSPELRTLTLSNAGPILIDGVSFDSHASWGPVPLTIPSLTKLVLEHHDRRSATAIVQHLDMPNLRHLIVDLDTEDYSDFVQALAKPVTGRRQSLLRQITHLRMTGLSFDQTSVKVLLLELVSLESLYLKLPMREDQLICDALIDPGVLSKGPASIDLPKVLCPKLEVLATSFDDKRGDALVIARRDAGAPLKTIRRLPTMVRTYLTLETEYGTPE